MASMNPGIILGVQQPDFVNTLARSTAAAGMANQNRRQNALEQVYQQYGQSIAQGDQNALNALAQYDPQAALGIKQTHQSMQFDQEKMRMLRDKAKMDAQMQAAQLSAAERQQAADNLKAVLSGAATLYQQGDRAGYQAWIQQNGLDPAQYTFDQFPAHLASATGTIEALTEAADYLEGPETYRQVRGSELGLTGEDAGKLFNVGPDNKVSGIGGSSVTVNTGDSYDPRPLTDKPPKGYQRVYDEENKTWRDEPIPGSEVATDREQGETKLDLARADYDRKFNIVDQNIDKALQSLEQNGRWVAGYGSLLSQMPESEARNFQATLDTVKANLGFEELQNMRDNSPTGGALGQVSEREIAFLQAMQGNLDAAQSPEQLAQVLREIKARRAEFRAEREKIMGVQSQVQPGITGETEVDIDGQKYIVRPVD